ncbi:hypothetical protein RNZ50_19105 [Paracoccaceae bacterium Fryx2]|nr:hypothetical protein [Paracoccaceae bacterium Fryx2]
MTMNRSGAGLLAALALLCLQPEGLGAQTLPLAFEPPDMVMTPVCVARASDVDLVAAWGAWDGVALPDRDIGLINRDLRRLAEIDPSAWDATIRRVITLLPGLSASFTADHATLARIEQMIALGQLQELKSEGLVQRLLDRGDENSPRMLNALAGFLNEGIGIDRDTRRGADLLMAAGYGGNADALLTLSHLAVAGNAPEGWDINPQLAVTMAFGSLVGQIDPLICDRIARIAREFSSGKVVSLDHDLAVRWYRFAADLGDPIAAWRVAEYHLQSELVTKDNDVLLAYLTKAADGNLPYAQVALGRVHEAGALVPADLAMARTLYEAAAAQGDRAGLIRLSGFLEAQLPHHPEFEPAFLDTLDRLQGLADAPAWVFAKQATKILAVQGRWTGQAAARALLERGAAMDDPAAIVMLSQLDLGAARTEPEFYVAVDHLIHAVTTLGEAAPTADLQAAFLCKAPNAPLPDQAAYWAGAEAAIGSSSFQFSDSALAKLAADPDPLAMAALQTQALYGRATPLANLLAVLERDGSPASEVAFWTSYADRFANVATARAALALERAANPSARAAALNQFRAAVTAGEDGAALKLSKALLIDATDAARAETVPLLVALAQGGNGEAMAMLPDADPATYPTPRAVFDAFSRQIDERGDFLALMLAMPFLPDAAGRDIYRARAITAMHCAFPEAVAFAGVMGAEGNLDEAHRWLTIATHLAGQDSWQIVALADSYRALLGEDGDATALAFYEKAHALGNRTAVQRLLRILGNPAKEGYDPARIVTLYADLVARSDARQLPAVLDELARKDPKLRVAIESRLDLDLLYAQAAEAGDPAAMREHAGRLRAAAVARGEIEESTGWLVRASEGGDVPAMMLLAQAYSMGVGVPASLENARGWLKKAADAGDPTAIDMVKLFTVDAGVNR